MFATVLKPFYNAVAWIINGLHSGLAHITTAGWTWGVSIIALTVLMRLLLFPLFVKQIRSQREMQLLQPKIAALKVEYPDDRTKQSEMQMALFKEHGVNPFSGCLPLVVQLPVFFALYGVLRKFSVSKGGTFQAHYHLSAATIKSAATSKFLGVPIAASFSSSKSTLATLHAVTSTVKTVTIIMIVAMMLTSFITSRQMIARTKASGTQSAPGADATAKVMMYGIPIFFGFIGLNFPMGVLLYWLTTNVWTFGQQAYVLNRMNEEAADEPGPSPAEAEVPATG